MGRPPKEGLDYMTIDVDMWKNKKIRLFRSEFAQGEDLAAYAVLLLLLSRIYGGLGYYIEWDEEEKLLFSQDVGVTPEYCEMVVETALKRRLFDRSRYDEKGVLTSEEITSRFVHAAKLRRGVLIDDQIGVLCDQTRVILEKTRVSSAVSTHRIGKDRIEKGLHNSGRKCPVCGHLFYGDFCKRCGGEKGDDGDFDS